LKLNKVKQKLLVSTNDSVIRLIGLDDFCTVRQYKGSMVNNSLQIQARFSESGEYIVCGSESGTCTIWNTATMRNPLKIVVSGLTNYDTIKAHECFEASKADPPIVTDTIFVPSKTMKEALRASHFFPSMDFVSNVPYDMSSAAIITCDYEGTIRVFLRKSCLDAVFNAANDPIV
jgi:WD40 repeat protein